MSASDEKIAELVKKKIEKDEICENVVEGTHVSTSFAKVSRYISLIERQGDHALFIYSSKSLPCRSASDLRLVSVYQVDGDLRLISEPSPKDKSPFQAPAFLGLQVKDQKILYELPQGPDVEKFLKRLKEAKDLQSQNAGFGLPSSFSWVEPYRKQMVKNSPLPPRKVENPFETDVFDPLRYMNLGDNKDGHSSAPVNTMQFEDDFNPFKTDSTMDTRSCIEKSSSKDSLDLLESYERYDNFSESLDMLAEQEFGFKPESQMAGDGLLKPTTARETMVDFFLKEREREYVDIETFRVFAGTWNVNGQNSGDLTEWLACDKEPPDLYAIGFQELDLSNQAYIFSDSQRETEWQDAVKRHLHPKARYRKVKSIRLVGVLLIVYIKDIHVQHTKLIDCDSVPTGIMGMLGNKGGVGVRVTIHNTSLCFMNSHLAAHQDETARRNQDFQDIEAKMRFKQFLPPLTVQDHDIVFWLGDLNYRIDMDINMVKDYVKQGMLHKLLPKDQLYKQLSSNVCIKMYSEGEINFPPTYRYDTGTDNFDTSEKRRNPAWCDRVLWKGSNVRQIIYRSHPSLKISDHKPVSGLFDVGMKVIEHERYKKVYEDIMKKLDRLENDYLPQVSLAQKEFVFDNVKFVDGQEQILAIANIGQVPVTYEFINKLDEDTYCKPWLKVIPYKAVISPGDSCEISLEVFVDKTSAYRFNSGQEKLEDILVMHLHGGKDFFIPISGTYIPSSFGSSIEALIQMHGPVQKVPTEQLIDLEQPGSLNRVDIMSQGTRLYKCPKEIWRLVDHIWQYGKHQEDLFQQPGLNSDIHKIRECLDSGVPDMIPGSIHSVAEALLLFLESLPEPVIPYSLYDICLESANSFLLCKQVMQRVPDCHRNVFKYMCAFLRELLEQSDQNNLEIKYVASMFGDVFLRAPPQATVVKDTTLNRNQRRQLARSHELKKAAFLYHFLTHEYDE